MLPVEKAEEQAEEEFRYGDLLEPFTPPPLEELLAAHKWEDRRVLDSLAWMREQQAKLGPPELSAAEALALHNDSDEDNRLILDRPGPCRPRRR